MVSARRLVVVLCAASLLASAARARAQDATRDGADVPGTPEAAASPAALPADDAERSEAEVAPAPARAVVPVDEGERTDVAPTPTPAAATPAAPAADAPSWGHVRSRIDAIFSWAPRYRLQTSADPLGLEQELWRRVEMLALYHRVGLDATLRIDPSASVGLHFSGWGSLDLLADSSGAVAAGDVAIGYVELSVQPVEVWVGRRFLPYGPPGGVHVDGGGAAVRSSFGLYADAFVGRPVTPTRSSLLGPQTSFEGSRVAYGARVGWSEPGTFSASASYTELWAEGIVGSRTIDVAATGDPGPLHLEGTLKLDVASLGVVHAGVGVSAELVRELTVDADYLHVEPGRWIPTYSILSVFETSTFDEATAGATLRVSRTVALRLELAGRLYSGVRANEPTLGYRTDLTFRLAPRADRDPSARVLVSRRDDGTLGYTLVEIGGAVSPVDMLVVALDGALALDDAGGRLSTIGRASLDAVPRNDLAVGATIAVARTPFAESEVRAMVRARWSPEAE